MTSRLEKGGGTFKGIKLLLCENPLPPLEEAIEAAREELGRSNYYTEPHSAPLRSLLSDRLGVPEDLIHINAGSELILRQIFDRLGQQVHLLTPTYALFPEIARRYTETRLSPERDFAFPLENLEVPPRHHPCCDRQSQQPQWRDLRHVALAVSAPALSGHGFPRR